MWRRSEGGRLESNPEGGSPTSPLPDLHGPSAASGARPGAGLAGAEHMSLKVELIRAAGASDVVSMEHAAAPLQLKWICGVVGRGALGAAYLARLPSGAEVALKLAAIGSSKWRQLRREAAAYLAVRDVWGEGVPDLLLAGPLLECGAGYGIGTAFLDGRILQPGDAGLLPAAQSLLHRIHSKGVIHGDLRRANFIVMHRGGSSRIWLLDFSHCLFSGCQRPEGGDVQP